MYDPELNRQERSEDDKIDLLRVDDLRIAFQLPEGRLEAVRGVSFRIRPGATMALVGESGSGKSVVSQAIMGILPKAASIDGGQILFADPGATGNGTDPTVSISPRSNPAARLCARSAADVFPSSSRSR